MYINHKSPKGTNWELMSNLKKNEDTLTDSDYKSFNSIIIDLLFCS